MYILFIGAVEVIGAWLLLWERTKLFGVAMLLPVMVNIIVFDIVFLDAYGALASAIIYTGLLFLILACHWRMVTAAALALVPQRPPHAPQFRRRVGLSMLAATVVALLFAIDQLLVNLLGHGRG